MDAVTDRTGAVVLGAVFTRRWIADLVLDLAGYLPTDRLATGVAIEPACGPGTFVASMAERLLESCRHHGDDIAQAVDAIVAVDIDSGAVAGSRDLVVERLTHHGVPTHTARTLARSWVRQGDFLDIAADLPTANWIVGNPPYVRIENIDRDALHRYRARWSTMTGRADIYVGFIEASLDLLSPPSGRLAFICADRWMRNQYGTKLREKVTGSFAVEACIVLHEVDAFEEKVAAYPAITVIRPGPQGSALVAEAADGFDEQTARGLARLFTDGGT